MLSQQSNRNRNGNKYVYELETLLPQVFGKYPDMFKGSKSFTKKEEYYVASQIAKIIVNNCKKISSAGKRTQKKKERTKKKKGTKKKKKYISKGGSNSNSNNTDWNLGKLSRSERKAWRAVHAEVSNSEDTTEEYNTDQHKTIDDYPLGNQAGVNAAGSAFTGWNLAKDNFSGRFALYEGLDNDLIGMIVSELETRMPGESYDDFFRRVGLQVYDKSNEEWREGDQAWYPREGAKSGWIFDDGTTEPRYINEEEERAVGRGYIMQHMAESTPYVPAVKIQQALAFMLPPELIDKIKKDVDGHAPGPLTHSQTKAQKNYSDLHKTLEQMKKTKYIKKEDAIKAAKKAIHDSRWWKKFYKILKLLSVVFVMVVSYLCLLTGKDMSQLMGYSQNALSLT
jgi:hypothetical protein